jgi:histidine ammonia-lyase
LKTSPSLQHAHSALRAQVPFAEADRLLAYDIEAAAETIRMPAVQSLADFLLPSFR